MFLILSSAIILLILDFIYLSSFGRYFTNQIEKIQKSPFEIDNLSTILTYIILVLGLYYFILRENRGVVDAFLLGLVVYLVFELTNKAIFNKWSWTSVAIDGLWGGILFAVTTFLTYKIYKHFH